MLDLKTKWTESGLQEDPPSLILVFFVLIESLPVLGLLAHRGLAPALFIASIVCVFHPQFWREYTRYFFKTPFLPPFSRNARHTTHMFFLLFCGWVLLSVLWTPTQGRAGLFLNVLTPVMASGVVVWGVMQLDDKATKILAQCFIITMVIAVSLLSFETFSGGALRSVIPPTDDTQGRYKDLIALARGAGAMSVLVFPALTIIWARHRVYQTDFKVSFGLMMVLIVLCVFSVAGLGVAASLFGFIFGLMMGVIGYRWPKLTVSILLGGTLLALWGTPIFVFFLPADVLSEQLHDVLPVSWLQRLHIGAAIGAEIPGGLPFGHGVDYARHLAQNSAMITIPGYPIALPLIPTHPHNVFLQIWLELGLVGVLLGSGLIIAGGKWLLSKDLSCTLLAGTIAVMSTSLLSFMVEASLWQVWRLAVIGIAVFGLGLTNKLEKTSS